jgi:hypothetical protein
MGGGGSCLVRAFANIPEAIHYPWGLALGGSWSVLSGSHLTYLASEDIPAHGRGGSANPPKR